MTPNSSVSLPITNERGETLVSIHRVSEAMAASDGSVTVGLMIARHERGTVLVHNRRRHVWELPGGLRETGESAREGAARELLEETGYVAVNIEWLGLLGIECRSKKPEHYRCALFRCRVEGDAMPLDHGEVREIAYWTPDEPLEDISAIDAALLAAFGAPNVS